MAPTFICLVCNLELSCICRGGQCQWTDAHGKKNSNLIQAQYKVKVYIPKTQVYRNNTYRSEHELAAAAFSATLASAPTKMINNNDNNNLKKVEFDFFFLYVCKVQIHTCLAGSRLLFIFGLQKRENSCKQ